MLAQGWVRSDTGRVRESNQDRYFCDGDLGVFAVADGMGGRAGGEVASAQAVRLVEEAAMEFRALADAHASGEDEAGREAMFEALTGFMHRVNSAVYQLGSQPAYPGGIGTTLDLVVLGAGVAYVAHVGDSRVYLMREGAIYRITRDHTFEQHLRDHPELRAHYPDAARYTHVLTRCIGSAPHVEVDTVLIELEEGDRLLMCSDGLTRYLSGAEIATFGRHARGEALVQGLLEASLTRGGRDNVTALIVEISELNAGDFQRHPTRRDSLDKVELLRELALFEELDVPELLKVVRYVYVRGFEAGEQLVRRGDEVDGLYLIVSGEVSVRLAGRELNRVRAGGYFGELALFGEPVRSADACAEADGEALFLSREHLRELVTEDPGLGNKVLLRLLAGASRLLQEIAGTSA